MSDDGDNPFDLDEIRQKEQTEILYRLDERTERMEGRIGRMAGRVNQQSEMLDEHDNRIQRNSTIINAVTFGVGSFVTGVLAKVGGLIKF